MATTNSSYIPNWDSSTLSDLLGQANAQTSSIFPNYSLAPTPVNNPVTAGGFTPANWDMLNAGKFNSGQSMAPTSPGSGAFGTGGWAMPAITAASSIMGGWLGMKQYGLAKDAFKESKRQFNLNYNTQRGLTNTRLEDRQRARVASNSGAYQSVGDYMKENRI